VQPKTRNELRCTCRRQPLIGTYGLDENGQVYVHVKVYKNRKIFGEIVIEQGSKARLRCRECYRWYSLAIGIRRGHAELIESPAPVSIDTQVSSDHG
jgi:hypothetical protein